MKHYSTYPQTGTPATIPPGGKLEIPRLGAYCRCLYASNWFFIVTGDSVGSRMEQGVGFFLPEGQEFNSVTIENPQIVPLDVIMAFSDGRIDDNRMSISSVLQVQGEVAAGPIANNFQPMQANISTVAGLIFPANGLRTKCVIKAGVLYDLFLGPNNFITPATGFKLQASESAVFEHKGAIYGIRASGAEPVTGWQEIQ